MNNPYSKRRIAFMHIAKTAGTSVNEYFKDVFGGERVLVHAEGKRDILNSINSDAHKQFIFLSGHLRLPIFLRLIDLREWFLFTCLRNPIDHVISHLQWVKAIGHPDNAAFRDTHHDDIKRLALDLYEVSLNDIDGLRQIIFFKHSIALQLFDNCQTRYFLPEIKRRLNISDFRYALNLARCLDFIARSESVEADVKSIVSKLNLNWFDGKLNHSNKRRISEIPDLEDKETLSFYRDLIAVDQMLYDAIPFNDLREQRILG